MDSGLGPIIQSYLKEKGLSQKYIAKQLGLTDSKLSAILQGKQQLKAEVYLAICEELDLSVNYFYDKLS